jgi:hypothetical protein
LHGEKGSAKESDKIISYFLGNSSRPISVIAYTFVGLPNRSLLKCDVTTCRICNDSKDFYGNGEPVTDPKFGMSKNLTQPLKFLIKNHPPLTKPFTTVGVSPGVTQAAFVDNNTL